MVIVVGIVINIIIIITCVIIISLYRIDIVFMINVTAGFSSNCHCDYYKKSYY